MELIAWNETLMTGISIIDAQHKVLINKINKLNSSINKVNILELNVLLDELLEYTSYHFDTEEDYFEKFNYSDREAHLKEHNSFKNYLKNLLNVKIKEDIEAQRELLEFLKKWVEYHIRDIDMKYVEFMKEKIK